MAVAIRAVYKNGHLELLDPVNLAEGQQVALTILTEEEHFQLLFGDMLVKRNPPKHTLTPEEEETIMRDIEEAFRGQPPLSETIIEDREDRV